VLALDGWAPQVSQRMTDEGRINPAIAVKLLFKGKDHKRLRDIFPQQANSPLAPRPELRRNIIDNRNAALMHSPCNTPVERGRVDYDGKLGLSLIGFGDELVEQPPDFRKMGENFGDANDRESFGVDYR